MEQATRDKPFRWRVVMVWCCLNVALPAPADGRESSEGIDWVEVAYETPYVVLVGKGVCFEARMQRRGKAPVRVALTVRRPRLQVPTNLRMGTVTCDILPQMLKAGE